MSVSPQSHVMLAALEQAVRRGVQSVLPALSDAEYVPAFEHPADTSHGEWSTNIALQLFGQHKSELVDIRSPRQFAETLVVGMGEIPSVTVSVAGPGFINFSYAPAVFFTDFGYYPTRHCGSAPSRLWHRSNSRGGILFAQYCQAIYDWTPPLNHYWRRGSEFTRSYWMDRKTR
ncbi:hypothetical protein LRY60_02885 [Candidatus Woesebacteria bacterium]|nr:hypothetical protein [Candidatus Woesebacteria bacterium]